MKKELDEARRERDHAVLEALSLRDRVARLTAEVESLRKGLDRQDRRSIESMIRWVTFAVFAALSLHRDKAGGLSVGNVNTGLATDALSASHSVVRAFRGLPRDYEKKQDGGA